jgi:hypothetical protein
MGAPSVSNCPSKTGPSGRQRLRGTAKGTDQSTDGCAGWGGKVVRIKECQLKKPERVVGRVAEAIGIRL